MSTLLDCFIQYKGCKCLNRFHLFFTYISTSFSSQKSSVLCQPCMPSTVQISTQSTAVGLWLRRRSRPFRFRRCFYVDLFQIYIYTRERPLLAKSAKQSKGKGVSRRQLQCQATTALRKNSVHLNRARVIEINVCER